MRIKIYELVIPGRPKPKQRPRVTKNSTYNPSKKDEDRILYLWKDKYGNEEIEGDLAMVYDFYLPDRRHGDLKNLIALVEDALGGGNNINKPFNDKQVKYIEAVMHFEFDGDPRTEVEVRDKYER